MKIINTIGQLTKNLKKLNDYLEHGSKEEQDEVRQLIKRGTCFVAYNDGKQLRFAPSRFIGYTDNTLDRHSANATRDGRETNPAISQLLAVGKPAEDAELEKQYQQYCHSLGVVPNPKGSFGVSRKYWRLK